MRTLASGAVIVGAMVAGMAACAGASDAGGLTAACERYDPAWSPDGRWLVFVSNCEGNPEIYRTGRDGSGTTRLTRTSGAEHTPRWSPDGSRIAYALDPDSGTSEIMVMDADGTSARAVTRNDANDWGPTWSPDGGRLAFESNRDGNADVWIVEVATGAERRLTRHAANDVFPAWSPDGRTIAYQTNRDGHYAVYGVEPAGDAAARRLFSRAGNAVTPSWAPDGTLLFAFQPEGEGDLEIYRVAADDGDVRALTQNEDVDFAPVGSMGGDVAFMVREPEGWTVVIMPGDGTARIRVGGGPR